MNKTITNQGSNKSFGIYHDLTINAPIEKVFEAVSDPKHLINWWPLKCEGKPILGSEYNFYFTPEYDWYGKVSGLIPNQSFHIKMTKSDLDWDSTTFGFDLEEQSDNVLLHFFHTGWPERNSHYRVSSFCWAMLLKGLKDYLEKGIILPFEERS
ncbi:SRPBCC domain-containing protein [Aureibaculum sp. 2210JD6-5]|uniref:SRPBCC family protein n=1 Tax=Aureibaculum sp. 2210JD6-5 TaxID=3103957 RepID=UPI002AAC7AB5|nr:SRPBCC domain-containing protein [Aureibaculum sp. 2210JD6-5]MDY7396700.1 SRPBCC domain-containing protein [Aureibaculum sp. 2210JD6-5]